MYDPSKDPADNERVVSGLYAGKQGFRPERSQPGAGSFPYHKPKTPRICPTIFCEVCKFIFVFVIILFYFNIPVSGGVRDVPLPWLRPCSWAHQFRENSLRNGGVNMALNTPYRQWIRKNTGLV